MIPAETLGHSKSTRNRSRDPSGHFVASKSVSKSCRECPGTSPGRPRSARRVPKHAQGRQKERPAAPRRNQNRRQIAPRIESIEFLKRGSFANPFRHVFLTIVVNFGLNSRRFSRSLRASESTRRGKSRTLIFTDRRGTSEGSRSLRTNGKSTKSVENIASRSDSCRSRNAFSKNNENRPENRPGIVKNRVWERRGIDGSRDRGIEGIEGSRDRSRQRGTEGSRNRGIEGSKDRPEDPRAGP